MPAFLISLILLVVSSTIWCQDDSISNSFDWHYGKNNQALKYSYDESKQIHDYTGNWDFDSDGKNDRLLFIGTGGAHLYFYLRVILSSDSLERNYHFLESDMPMLTSFAELKKADFNLLNMFVPFAIFDFDGDHIDDIFIELDTQTFLSSKKKLKTLGVTSPTLVITFKKGKAKFQNYR